MSFIVKYKSLWFDTVKECSYFVLSVNAGRFNEKLMYCGKYAPWDHYPKNLRISEVLNPMSVVIDFFSSDRIQDHQKRFKEWRDFVTDEYNYFNQSLSGPGVLIYTYEQHLKLLEAMFLLLLQHQDDWTKPKEVTLDQLAIEQEQWEYFPDNLSEEQLKNPYRAIKEVFSKIKPQQYRDYLHEWLYVGLTTNNIDESMQASEIIYVYENVLKLYAAAWVIHQRNTAHTYFKVGFSDQKEHTAKSGPVTDAVHVDLSKTVTPLFIRSLTPADQIGLKEVTKVILKNEPLVKAIFHLGTMQDPFTYFLYILIDEKKYYRDYEVNEHIENASKSLVPLIVMLDSANVAQDTTSEGRRFFDYVLKTGSMAYQSNDVIIPGLEEVPAEMVNADRTSSWEWWKNQSQGFFKVAKYIADDHEYNMALYFLHQSLEMSLLGLLEVKTGFHTTFPNFRRMIKMTLLFTYRINKFFEHLSKSDKELHYLLWNVHPVEVRHNLVVNELHIERLLLRVSDMFGIVDELIKEDT